MLISHFNTNFFWFFFNITRLCIKNWFKLLCLGIQGCVFDFIWTERLNVESCFVEWESYHNFISNQVACKVISLTVPLLILKKTKIYFPLFFYVELTPLTYSEINFAPLLGPPLCRQDICTITSQTTVLYHVIFLRWSSIFFQPREQYIESLL